MSSDEPSPKVEDESCALASKLGVVKNPGDEAQATQSSSASTTESVLFERGFSSEYTIQTVIGRGGFGAVFKAKHKLDERLYAIKRVNVADTEQSRNKVLREVRFMAPLDHPHIVRYYDAWLEKPPPGWQQEHDDNLLRELRSRRQQQNGKENNVPPDPEDVTQTETELLAPKSMVLVSKDERIVMVDASEIANQIRTDDMSKEDACTMMDNKLAYLYIKMEFCCGPTLHKWLRQNQRPDQRPISQTLDWFSQLVSAVKYIHSKDLIHRDIKPGNIFFGSSRDGAASVLKIGDLGLAIDVAPSSSSGADGNFTASSSTTSSRYTQSAGTKIYMSPEQLFGHRCTTHTDIFSLGLVFLETMHPFKTDRERRAAFEALRAKKRPAVMNKLDGEMGALISRMTAFESEKRATSSELDNELKKKRGETNGNVDLHHQFEIPDGFTGYGYDRVFADCLDEELTSVRVEDPYIRSDFQIQNFFRLCELLDRKCKKLERVTLITANQGRQYEAKIKQKVKRTLGDRLHFEYEKDLHDRKIDFGNGWRATLGRGLDFYKKLADPSSGDADDMSRRACKKTTISVHRGETNVNADLRHQLKIPADSMSSREESRETEEQLPESEKEIGVGPHAKTNDGTNSNVKSEIGTSSLAAIAAVDGAGSSASKCLKPDSSNEVHISCSGTSTVPSSEYPDIGGPSIDNGIPKRANFTDLPLELMLKIFGYLYEGDLTQCALVSRKFRAIANHEILWTSLYQEVFEYSRPLLHVGHARFEFREPHDWPQPRSNESIVVNPWKESFKQLKDGIHVRPGYAPLYSGFGAGGRRLTQCDRLDQALQLVKARDESAERLIFLHTGLYIPETTVTINSDIQIIGASAGPDVASQVIIEGRRTTTVTLAKGSQGAYLGWMTVRFAPDPGAVAAIIAAGNSPMHRCHFALQICDDSTALVEHCVIHASFIARAAVCVNGSAANPKMRHCRVSDCGNAGIYVTDAAQGQFEGCEIARNNLPGVWVENHANPFFRRCHIHDGRSAGIFTSEYGMGYFESCNIHNNRFPGIGVEHDANPTVTRCEVHHGQALGIYVYNEGRGEFIENRIHSNAFAGIQITSHSDPKITRNKIWGNQEGGIAVSNNGQGVLEDNEISDNAKAGVGIKTDGNPMLRRNKIYDGRGEGVYISNKGRGVLEENDICRNALTGIVIERHSNPKITRNKIRGNQEGGVLIHNGQGVLEDNEIFDNAKAGIWIKTGGNPTLRRNKIHDGRGEGIYISNKGRGVLEENDICRNAKTGVLILSELNPTLRGNRVYEGHIAGIEIRRGAMATLESNAIFHNRFGGLFLATGVQPTLRDNKIYDNDDLVEKTIAKGGCLFEISSWTSLPMHDFYYCDTCNTTEMHAICLNCIRTCHAGHAVRLMCCDRFLCSCGAGTLKHQCKLQSEARDNDLALPP